MFLPNLGGGGAERVALASIRDLVARGHRVDLVLMQATGELLPLLPKDVRIVDLNVHRQAQSVIPLVRYLRTEKPDALHALMWPLTIIAVIACRLARSAATLVISDHVVYSQGRLGARQLWLLRLTTALFYRFADHRIVVSEGAADDLAALSGLSREAFEVIYNPISPPIAISSAPEVERQWKKNGPRIITLGSFKAQKNHALLLAAFARLSRTDAELMILGEGMLRRQLELQAEELGIADRVHLPGFVIDPWPYLASADLFVLSSDFEGFANVVAEALYAGLNVVSTDCPAGPREILDSGRYGRLVPCGDVVALARAIEEALLERSNPGKQRARALEISGPHVEDRYAELLTS